MSYTIPTGHGTPVVYPSPPIRLDPGERFVERTTCWRPACRERHGAYRTVVLLRSGRRVAFCHRRVHDDLGFRADRGKYGQAAA